MLARESDVGRGENAGNPVVGGCLLKRDPSGDRRGEDESGWGRRPAAVRSARN